MRILEIHVSAFGVLRDFRMMPNTGLNTLLRPNGWGKSTFVAFLSAMLYGFSERSSGEGSARRRYAPRNGGVFGGSISFSTQRGSFRAERFFGSTAREDRFTLWDLSTNEESNAYSARLGEELFSIDAEGFSRTLLFSRERSVRGKGEDLAARLASLVEAAEDAGDFSSAEAALEKRRRYYRSASGRGRHAELEAECISLERECEEMREERKTLPALLDERTRLDAEIKKAEAAERMEREAGEPLWDRRLAMRREDLVRRVSALSEEAKKTDAEMRPLLLPKKEKIKLRACVEDYAEALRRAETAEEPPHVPMSFPAACIGGILLSAVLWTLCAFLSSIPSGIFGALALLFSAVAGILWAVRGARYRKDMREYGKLLQAHTDAKEAAHAALDAVFAPRHKDPRVRFEFLLRRESGYRTLLKELRAAREHLEVFDRTYPAAKEAYHAMKTAERLRARNAETTSALSGRLRERRAVLNLKIERVRMRSEALEGRENALRDARRALAEAHEAYNTLTLTLEYLKKARESLSARYPERMERRLNVYLQTVARDAPTLVPDAALALSVRTESGTYNADTLSLGWQALADFCMRLSLLDVLFENTEAPILILDDPFVHLDEAHVAAALRLLSSLSERYQIFYTVCHKDRGGDE